MADESDLRINLNPPARKPAPDAPWGDDALQRQSIASELDALVSDLAGGAEAATIALDGGYGTGKTFILERWVQEMHGRGQIAVYYNAWENDCDDDPLVSLIETLTSNDKTNWGKRLGRATNEAVTGILRKSTGIDAQKTWKAGKDRPVGLLDAARHRRESRQKLKEILAKLVEEAQANGKSGVVVVVDELDRCRPTFAKELMERVKHVLNVPGLVFAFGVNVVALRKTVQAAYGDIDAHQYLLRMFTTTLHMPPGIAFPGHDPDRAADAYLSSLADRHGLRTFCERDPLLQRSLRKTLHLLRIIASAGGFAPREMESVMWLLSKVASVSLDAHGRASSMFPTVLVPLTIARIKDPDAYYQTVSRPDNAPAVIDCVFDLIPDADLDERDLKLLDKLEMTMYRVCHQHPLSNHTTDPPAYLALRKISEDPISVPSLDSRYLSRRSTNVAKERAATLLKLAPLERSRDIDGGVVEDVTWTFDTLRLVTSRFDVVWPREQA